MLAFLVSVAAQGCPYPTAGQAPRTAQDVPLAVCRLLHSIARHLPAQTGQATPQVSANSPVVRSACLALLVRSDRPVVRGAPIQGRPVSSLRAVVDRAGLQSPRCSGECLVGAES